jgi:hydrogenase/urease accessory protein HupE
MRGLFSCLLFLIITACASAHDPSISGLKIILEKDGAIVSVLTHISNFGQQDARQNFAGEIKMLVNGKPWVCRKPDIMLDPKTDLMTLQAKITEPVETIEVLNRLFPNKPVSKTIITVMKDGEAVGQAVLTAEFLSWKYVGVAKANTNEKVTEVSAGKAFWTFFTMGINHILSGPDHLLFIFGLILARPRIKELIKVATSFTVAHSITLSLCALNIFTLPSRIVEPLIALSIVAVAAEKFMRPNDKVWRTVAIAFFFGLVHGFGFAGALTEAGLPPHQAAISLLSFNLGVETVQASIILITVPLLLAVSAKKPKFYVPATMVCAVLISLAGGFWFIERIVHG